MRDCTGRSSAQIVTFLLCTAAPEALGGRKSINERRKVFAEEILLKTVSRLRVKRCDQKEAVTVWFPLRIVDSTENK